MEEVKNVKTGISAVDCRKKREEVSVQIRKSRRADNLRKRRMMTEKKEEEVAVVDENVKELSASLKNLEEMMTYMKKSNANDKLAGTRAVRKLLSRPNAPPVAEVVDYGFLPLLCEFLKDFSNTKLQFEAAWALTNIGSSEMTYVLVDNGILPLLAPLLRVEDAALREQAAWCVGNIAGDRSEYRDLILNDQALFEGLLLNLEQPANPTMMRNITWTVSNLCRGNKPKPSIEKLSAIVPRLKYVLENCGLDEETMVDACWAFSYVSDGDNDYISLIVENGLCETLVALLGVEHESREKCIAPCVRTLGNIVTGTDTHTQRALDSGILKHMLTLLKHNKTTVRKEAAWTCSNVTAGTKDQIESFLQNTEIVDSIIRALAVEEWNVKREAAWTISNICTGGSQDQIRTIVDQYNVIKPLCEILGTCAESKILSIAMGSIEQILRLDQMNYAPLVESYGGLDHLERLQEEHSDDSIYEKARAIIEEFFLEDDEEDFQLDETENNSSTFSFGKSSNFTQDQPQMESFSFANFT